MRKIIFVICWLVLYPYYSYSISLYPDLESLTMQDGLSNNTIHDIYYEKSGFIWFSTDVGISKYDGFRFRNFCLASDKVNSSFSLHSVRQMIENPNDGLFYLRLAYGKLVCFDKLEERYIPLRLSQELDVNSITSSYISKEYVICIGTKDGLYMGKAVRTGHNADEAIVLNLPAEPIVKGDISKLCSDGRDNLYGCMNKKEVFRYNMISKKLEILKTEHQIGEQTGLYRGKVKTLCICGDRLWIGYAESDILCYNLKRKSFRTLHNTNISVSDVSCIDEQNYCLATLTGLYTLTFDSKNIDEAEFTINSMISPEQANHIENRITKLYQDTEQKILWIGTFGGGILKANLRADLYNRVIQPIGAGLKGLEEDTSGKIWLLTQKREIWRSTGNMIANTMTFEPYNVKTSIDGSNCLYKDRNGNFWLGNDRSDILRIDPLTGEMKKYKLLPDNKKSSFCHIWDFCLDSRNRLWIATREGLVLFDYKSGDSRFINDADSKIRSVYAVVEDKEGNIWAGTNIGLKRVEAIGKKISLIGNYEFQVGFENSPVYSVYVNSYNQIFASYAEKIVRIDGRDKNRVETVFTLMDGLGSSRIFCMVDDQNGNTWAGSNSGIVTIRNDRKYFYTYISSGYFRKMCRLKDGRLLCSDSWGLAYFDPRVVKNALGKKNVQLSEIRVNGKSVSVGERVNGQVLLTTFPGNQSKFTFNAANSSFDFYFSDFQYGMMQRKIAYRLLPIDKEWKIVALEDGIGFSRLPEGTYTLQVKTVYPDASEGNIQEFTIYSKAHWWLTIWAFSGYFLIMLVICMLVHYYSVKREKKREQRRNREMELKETLEQATIKHERKQELDMIRNQLLILLMQELRTPLSLIIAPLKEMSQEFTLPSELLPKIQVAYRNSVGMLDVCNQLLDIYVQDSPVNSLEISVCPANKVLDRVLFTVSEVVRVNQIEFHCERKIKKETEIWGNYKNIEFVLHNLLSNAFNHIHFAGTVKMIVQETVEEDVEYCVISIWDSGKQVVSNLSLEESDPFQSDLSRIELGFDAMERVMSLHHGSIVMKSEEGMGTQVIVNFPMSKNAFEDDSNVVFVDPEVKEAVPIVSPEVSPQKTIAPEKPVLLDPDDSSLPAKGKKTLLVVEDHKDIRLYLKVLLGKEYNMLMATNGQEGIDIARREKPDLILSDVMMPVKDGFVCCKEIKENPETCHIPFIMLTAKVEDDDILKGLEMGADDYMLKPFTPSILKAKVRNLINGRLNLKQMYTKLLMLPGSESEFIEDEKPMEAEDPFIASVIKIVEENIREADFSVKKLAADMNMSQPTLYRKVKQSTDFTIIELIRGVRMRKAAMLLKQKIYAVQEVAEMVGYNDIPTFRKHFVDAFGTTPSNYSSNKEMG